MDSELRSRISGEPSLVGAVLHGDDAARSGDDEVHGSSPKLPLIILLGMAGGWRRLPGPRRRIAFPPEKLREHVRLPGTPVQHHDVEALAWADSDAPTPRTQLHACQKVQLLARQEWRGGSGGAAGTQCEGTQSPQRAET